MVHFLALVDSDLFDLISDFIQNRKRDVRQMREAASLGDFAKVSFINSEIIGMALSYGFTGLDTIAKEIADACENRGVVLALCDEINFYLSSVYVMDKFVNLLNNEFSSKVI